MLSFGEVNFFNEKKQIGMIKDFEDKVYFFAEKDVKNAIILVEGNKVKFTIHQGVLDGKWTAKNIEKVEE